MINYTKQKEMLLPLGVMLFVLVMGSVFSVFFYIQKVRTEIKIDKKVKILGEYLKDVRTIPTKEKVKELTEYKKFLESQIMTIILELKKKGDFSKQYANVVTPLEFKELVAQTKKEYSRALIGFEDYESKVPVITDVSDLKRQLSLIVKLFTLAKNNKIENINEVIRLERKEIKDNNILLFSEYPCLISFSCASKDLISLIYDIGSAEELLIIRGVKLDSGENETINVILKVSYMEIAK